MSNPRGVRLEDLEIDLNHVFSSNKDSTSINDQLQKIEFQRQGRIFNIPTDDSGVREILRYLGVAESLEDETERLRRERLILLVSTDADLMKTFNEYVKKNEANFVEDNLDNGEDNDEEDDEFYTPASNELIEARKFLLNYSLENSKKRLELAKESAKNFNWESELTNRRNSNDQKRNINLKGSQVSAEKPISVVKFAPLTNQIASGSWDGDIAVIRNDTLDVVINSKSVHNGKLGGIEWTNDESHLISGGEDCLIKILKIENSELELIDTLHGHQGRVTDVKLHPSGKFLGSTSFDLTWRLWDIQTNQELLLQEGHVKEVFSISFQNDGALALTAGFDSIGMVWDLRSGKNILSLKGHAKPIYSLDWSPNGYQVATGSGDGTIKIWDLRKGDSNYESIFAHKNLVTSLQYDQNHGSFLYSAGYDKLINIYDATSYQNISTLEGHADKILTIDKSKMTDDIISAGWDRTVKLWGRS